MTYLFLKQFYESIFKMLYQLNSYFRMLKNVFMGEVGSELEAARQMEGLGITLGLSCEGGWKVREGNFQ